MNDAKVKGVNLSEIKHIVIDGTITALAPNAFNCSSNDNRASLTALKTVRSDTVNYVGEGAFYGCTSLVSVSCPKVTGIGDYAFDGCTNLVSISNMPNLTAEKVDKSAFDRCFKLAEGTYHIQR